VEGALAIAEEDKEVRKTYEQDCTLQTTLPP
ncbi:hypothetical protein AK812_SmicGene47869, partial [Symbiodinium microadriaticum]